MWRNAKDSVVTDQEQAPIDLAEGERLLAARRARLLPNCEHEWEHITDRPNVQNVTIIFDSAKCHKCGSVTRTQVFQEDYEALMTALKAANEKVTDYEQTMRIMRSEWDVMNHDLHSMYNVEAQLRDGLVRVEAEREQQREQAQFYHDMDRAAVTQLDQLRIEHRQLEREHERLQARIAELEESLREMLNNVYSGANDERGHLFSETQLAIKRAEDALNKPQTPSAS